MQTIDKFKDFKAMGNDEIATNNSTAAHDNINHPPHYMQGNLEVIDIIEGQQLGYHDGNAVKYILRHRHKGKPVEDLKKAIWYLNRLIQKIEEE